MDTHKQRLTTIHALFISMLVLVSVGMLPSRPPAWAVATLSSATVAPLAATSTCPPQVYPDPTVINDVWVPQSLVQSADGAFWYIHNRNSWIGAMPYLARFIPGQEREVAWDGWAMRHVPKDIVVGPDQSIWFSTEYYLEWAGDQRQGSLLIRIKPTGEQIQFTLPSGSILTDLTFDGVGNLWGRDAAWPNRRIFRITPTGTMTEIPLVSPSPTGDDQYFPADITAGPDSSIWFGEREWKGIGQVKPDGQIIFFPIVVDQVNIGARQIMAGPDGNLWFTAYTVSTGFVIGRMTPNGDVSLFPVPDLVFGDGFDYAHHLVAGPAGSETLLFTLPTQDSTAVGQITMAGEISWLVQGQSDRAATDLFIGIDGAIWFPMRASNDIGRIAIDGSITTFSPNGVTAPRGIAAMGDHIASAGQGGYTTISPCGAPQSDNDDPTGDPRDVTLTSPCYTGIDGDISNGGAGRLIRICAGGLSRAGSGSTGIISQTFAIPTPGSDPWGITLGPDGNTWFTETGANKIGKMTSDGVFTEFELPTPASQPFGITSGPDGALWFTARGINKIGRITTAGKISEFVIPTAQSQPRSIVAGPDGALWFTEQGANKIGRITTAGQISEFAIPTPNSMPYGIAADSEAVWFTEFEGNKIGRIGMNGAITEIPLPDPQSGPYDIAVTSDQAIWVSLHHADSLVKMLPIRVASITFYLYLPAISR
jgi:streptogramin lyase